MCQASQAASSCAALLWLGGQQPQQFPPDCLLQLSPRCTALPSDPTHSCLTASPPNGCSSAAYFFTRSILLTIRTLEGKDDTQFDAEWKGWVLTGCFFIDAWLLGTGPAPPSPPCPHLAWQWASTCSMPAPIRWHQPTAPMSIQD